MKYFLMLFIISSFSLAQSQSSWETMNNSSKGFTMYYRFVKENDERTLEVKLMVHKGISNIPFTVSEGKRFILRFKDGSVVELLNLKNTQSCIGCGSTGMIGSKAEGGKMYYSITLDQFEYLCNNSLVEYTIYTDDDSYSNIVKEKKSNEFKNHLVKIK